MASPSFRFTNRNAPRLPAGPLPPQQDDSLTGPPPETALNANAALDLPPDQQGIQGRMMDTGLVRYTTPKGTFEMDPQGNWTDLFGARVNFSQGGRQTQGMGDMGGDPTGGSTYGASAPQQTPGSPGYNDPRVAYNPGQNFAAPSGGGGSDVVGPPGSTFTSGGATYKVNPDGSWSPVSTGGTGAGGPASGGGGATTAPATTPPAFNYLSGVTSANPLGGTNAVNSTQFATPGSAQALASRLGGNAYGLQLQGPGYGFSQPMQQIRFGNGQEINAGLAGDLYSKYGSAPGTYGNYLVNRDVTGDYGPSAYDTKQNASGAAEMAQIEAQRQQMAQFGQQATDQYQQQFAGQRQSEVQQATQALQANGWAQTPDGAWTNTRTGETQYADPVVLLMREMPGLQSISGSWEPPSMAAMQQQQQPPPQQSYAPPPQQQQPPQQPYYPPQPMPPQSTAQQGAERYQQTTQPQQYYPQPQQGQQMQSQQQPQQGYYGQQGGQQRGGYGGQQQVSYGQQPQYSQNAGGYGQQRSQYSQGSQYYPQQNSYGSGSQTQQQQPSQQGYYSAGQSSGQYKSPYGGGYLGYGNPTQSKSGGYMQTGKTTF